jgi:predicted RNase H-like HicB family nuclease
MDLSRSVANPYVGVAAQVMSPRTGRRCIVNLKAIVHEAEEGGYWAEVPALPGCATQGETMEELLVNLREAIHGCLSVDIPLSDIDAAARVMEIAV